MNVTDEQIEKAREMGPNRFKEIIENSFKSGKPMEVKIKRSSGLIEKGWKVMGIAGNDAVVIKTDAPGKLIRKLVPLEELAELNK